MMTQSVGVPFTAKCRSEISRRRKGSLSESECDTPLWSVSGATTHTSAESCRAMVSNTLRPGACTPSSLVTRMRIKDLDYLPHAEERRRRLSKHAHGHASFETAALRPPQDE